jgi:hypothetical protein
MARNLKRYRTNRRKAGLDSSPEAHEANARVMRGSAGTSVQAAFDALERGDCPRAFDYLTASRGNIGRVTAEEIGTGGELTSRRAELLDAQATAQTAFKKQCLAPRGQLSGVKAPKKKVRRSGPGLGNVQGDAMAREAQALSFQGDCAGARELLSKARTKTDSALVPYAAVIVGENCSAKGRRATAELAGAEPSPSRRKSRVPSYDELKAALRAEGGLPPAAELRRKAGR